MTAAIVILGLSLTAQPQPPDPAVEPAHAANPLFRAVRTEGLSVGGARVVMPAPKLRDGASAQAERAALRDIANSESAVAELTRNSVSAPFILKTRDEPAGDRGLIRVADLYFVVHAGLDAIDPAGVSGQAEEGREVEAGNMKFAARRLTGKDLAARRIEPARGDSTREWYVHMTGRLLDRIHVEGTDRIVATKSDGSWVVASRTEPAFDNDKEFPNRWYPIVRKGSRDEPGKVEPYEGGASYVKLSRLSTVPGALLVESHFAFFEPKAWFDGAPILRSKIGLVAQDRIRGLRRELAKSQRTQGSRRGSGPNAG